LTVLPVGRVSKLLASEHTATRNSYFIYARESAVAVNVGQGWPTGGLVMSVKKDHFLRCASQKLFKAGRAEFLSVRRNSLPDIEKGMDLSLHNMYLLISIIFGSMSLYRVVQKSLGTRGNILLGFFCTMTNKCTIISQISHSYMFRHYCVILRDLVVGTLLSYASMSNTVVGNTIQN
jgi:hypothetical protein